jgi:ATPase subunit of ABC transporter with duplicated ATPase domains
MEAFNFTYETLKYTYNSLLCDKFELSVGSKENNKILFIESTLSLSNNNIYSIIGKNGCGKSSLLKQLVFNNLIDDTKLRITYIEQEIIMDNRNPIEYILDSNIKLKYYQDKVNLLTLQLEDCEEFDENIYNELAEYEEQLQLYNPDKELSLIKKILLGLGLTIEQLEQPSNIFSGGYMMRISLARALYLKPDILLLDECTNHLDLEGIIWLSDYLQSYKKIVVVISHNIGFINEITDYILNIENKKLVSYKGDYYKFKSQYEKKLLEQNKEYNKYKKKLEEFKKKSPTKNALNDFIKKHEIPRPEKEYKVSINFIPINKISTHIVKIENISFSYPNKIIYENLSFGIMNDSKITLVGINASGKSTLMKLITKEVSPDQGYIYIEDKLRIGYYNQHFEQFLPFDKTPIEYLIDILPNDLIENGDKIQTIRSYLGKIKLEPTNHNKLIQYLSGGEKFRVAIIKLIFQQCHLLLLDEITNHADIEAVDAIIDALHEFNGAYIIITHDSEFIKKLDTEIWIVDNVNKTINFYNNDYDNYVKKILNELN